MTGKNVFIFGAGYSGKAFARLKANASAEMFSGSAPPPLTAPHKDEGDLAGGGSPSPLWGGVRGGGANSEDEIFGTTRSPEKFDALRQAGIEPLVFDGRLTGEIADALRRTSHLVVSIAPEETGDPVLNAAANVIATEMPALRWIGYLSTVGVYGDHDGAWVDENSPCLPVSRRSTLRVVAENAWLDIGQRIGKPVAVLRLSGIYGPGRNAFVNLRDGTARRLVKPGQVFNRIHVDDIAGALDHLARTRRGGIFNVTDDLPAPPQDVVEYAAGVMGVPAPPEIPFDTAQLSPMARSFYGENKRVANAAVKAAGYRFRFPDYRSAFDHMWASGDWESGEPRSPMKRA